MAVLSTDIQVRLSGGSSNSAPSASIGGAKSSVHAGADLFAPVTESEAASGSVKYRCVYVHNAHVTLSAQALRAWIIANTPSATTTVEIGVGAAAVNATETAIGSETTAPSSVTFSSPSTEVVALALFSVPAGQDRALWIKRTVTAGSIATPSDSVTLGFRCDSL